MKTAPRILALPDISDPAEHDPRSIASLGFTMVAFTGPAESQDRTALARLVSAARSSGLDVMTSLPPDEQTARRELREGLEMGVHGFLATASHLIPAEHWRDMIDGAHARDGDCVFAAEMLGTAPTDALEFRDAGFDFMLNSVRWWDGQAPWFLDQQALTRNVAASIGFPELPSETACEVSVESCRRRLLMAAGLSAGLMVNTDFLDQPALRDLMAETNRLKASIPALAEEGPMLRLSEAGSPVTAILRETAAGDDAVLVLINSGDAPHEVDIDKLLGMLTGTGRDLRDVTPGIEAGHLLPSPLQLAEGEVRILRAAPIGELIVPGQDLPPAAGVPRVVVERVWPALDGGCYPTKRVVGDRLEVWADIFRDGHDKIAAALWLQPRGVEEWRLAPMEFFDNDRWRGTIRLDHVGPTRFAISAWTDHFASWRDEVAKKRAANRTIGLELIEGHELVTAAAVRAAGTEKARIDAILAEIERVDETERADLLLSNRVAHAMARVPDRGDIVFQEPVGWVTVDREAARFSAWYGMFPRSQGTDPNKSASFADCAARLPEIAAMGFDVVYLTPIHPIGTVNRKGRNNSPIAEPGEPGSPYAIGSAAGGHDAIDPELGTIEDFRSFVRAVKAEGMEVALDFAIQCAPDHPWVTEHPTWFKRRPDGTIKFAENPPKKYEDIYNLDFDQPDWPALWAALRDVIQFWVREGVRIFRVDNPHTKPVAFWQWLIAEIQRDDPGVLFLAEAFTKPKMMQRLAKVGFSQSYTYFTWRNTKEELTQYLTELTLGEAAQYYRPIFFPSTPDILPFFLQTGGRAAFRIRQVLASTLSPAYGIYNSFELCEAAALPGREEYLDSEKYQYKVWDWDRPGNIKGDITRLNRLRRESPSLRLLENLRFHEATHGDVLFYSKIMPDHSDAVLVAVALEPKHVIRCEIVFPLEAMGLSADAEFETVELFTGERRRWAGARHWILLDPEICPAMVMHYRPAGGNS
ncbi:MAG TPA: alpha-1,4-glucan--maltose-1-phosphate maltosyltransferase [Aliidongia sp.]|nr:alpha-1,4-glucan--maltose-1-phosphate maltosyltransferase [Aliidongia sp.]